MIDLGLGNTATINTPLEEALQELDILFNTKNTELIGYPLYGTDFERFLWTLTPMKSELEKYIKRKILTDTYYVSKLKHSVNVEMASEKDETIYLITIEIWEDEDADTPVTREFVIR